VDGVCGLMHFQETTWWLLCKKHALCERHALCSTCCSLPSPPPPHPKVSASRALAAQTAPSSGTSPSRRLPRTSRFCASRRSTPQTAPSPRFPSRPS
jgi:hypothetical protein